MKYKVGDKTLLGKITDTDKEDSRYPYRVEFALQALWLTESEIDKIIIKPKRNIDHIIELWESGEEDFAVKFFDEMFSGCVAYSKATLICEMLKPYTEPSKLTAEERKALELAKACGFNWMCRIGDFISIGETKEAEDLEDGIISSWIPSLSILDSAKWLTGEPRSIDSLLEGTDENS